MRIVALTALLGLTGCGEDPLDEFCGYSPQIYECASDAECVTSGCAGSICQSAESTVIDASCEEEACMDAEAAAVECGCQANRCDWRAQ